MTETLTFYTNPRSRGAIARWMLEEVGAPYETVPVSFGAKMRTPEYLTLNPMGKVPVLRAGDQVITEAAAICVWLAQAFPDAGLAPTPAESAAFWRWMFFGAGPLEAAVTNHALGVEVPAGKRGFVGYGSYEAVLDTLEVAVSGTPYLAGERFTAADVYTGSQIGFGLMFGTIPKRPAFEAYWARLADRPARQRAAELDAALPED